MKYHKDVDLPAMMIFLVLIAFAAVFVAGLFLHGAIFMMGFAPFFGLFGIFWAFFWIMLLVLFFRWVFGFGGRRRAWCMEDKAEWIAKERYARGEISKREFEEIMKKLHEY